jgi:hypothetical protein
MQYIVIAVRFPPMVKNNRYFFKKNEICGYLIFSVKKNYIYYVSIVYHNKKEFVYINTTNNAARIVGRKILSDG